MTVPPSSLPRVDGFAMPPRFAPHARSYIAWPTEVDYRWSLEAAREEHAVIARAIAKFESVTIIADPKDAAEVEHRLGGCVETLKIPINDAWVRDNGPIFVIDGGGGVAAVRFEFNGWGNKYPHDLDAGVPERIAESMAMRCYKAPFVLEGGGFGVDGEGTLIATEQSLLNPNRNPGLSREEIEAGLRDYLGIEKVILLGKGLVEDKDTDGHVDNVCQFIRPGVVLLQTVRDKDNPNYHYAQDNLARLKAARDAKGRKLKIIELDILPYTKEIRGKRYPVPYVNYYVVNGAVIVPALGGPEDAEGLARLAEVFPDRKIVGVPSTALAADGGGVGCITQQLPAGRPVA